LELLASKSRKGIKFKNIKKLKKFFLRASVIEAIFMRNFVENDSAFLDIISISDKIEKEDKKFDG